MGLTALALVLLGSSCTIGVDDPQWAFAPGVRGGTASNGLAGPEGVELSTESGSSDAGPSQTQGSAGSTGAPCIDEVFAWEPRRPQIVLALDASGSMSLPMDGLTGAPDTRWGVLHQVVRAVLQHHAADVEFGLVLFPSAAASVPEASDTCALSEELEHPLSVNAGVSLLEAMPPATWSPYGATPMGAGLGRAAEALELADPTRPRAILMVADGGTSGQCGVDETLSVIEADVRGWHDLLGLRTFVVGIDTDPATASALEAIASAGGSGATGSGAGWFDPSDAAGLHAALDEVVQSLRSCDLELPSRPEAGALAVTVDGASLVGVPSCLDAGTGYAYDEATGRVELCAASCEAYLSGAAVGVSTFCEPG